MRYGLAISEMCDRYLEDNVKSLRFILLDLARDYCVMSVIGI